MRRLVLSVLLLSGCLAEGSPGMNADDLRALDGRQPDAADLPGRDSSPEIGSACDGTSRTCDGDHLLLCVEDVWTVVEPPCAFGCDPDGWCLSCRPGVVECHDQAVSLCNAAGDGWETQETCAPPCTTCETGACVVIGTCVGKTCGDSGCGETCGYCEVGETCEDGKCAPG